MENGESKIRKADNLASFHSPLFTILFSLFIFLFSCSTAPDRPEEILTERTMVARQLDLANQTANRGRFNDALLILDDARRFAISVDDPPLLIRTAISRGNILFALGRHEEAFFEWEAALEEAESSGNPSLASLARVYNARGRLILLAGSSADAAASGNQMAEAMEIRDQIRSFITTLEPNTRDQAAGNLILGMAEKELGNYAEAERTARLSLDYHVKNLFLEEAAYDWFFIASVYSVSNRFDDALAALNNSISYDRRAENGYGLDSSWQAVGEVYLRKDPYGEASRQDAVRAFQRSRDIFSSLGLLDLAARAEARAVAAAGS